jgi:hypothetical protein
MGLALLPHRYKCQTKLTHFYLRALGPACGSTGNGHDPRRHGLHRREVPFSKAALVQRGHSWYKATMCRHAVRVNACSSRKQT